MPDLLDRIYCSEQIHIPPTFPYIMKLYCKAAIRTQPYDLLKWSAAYFRALANGEEPPVKERIEYPPYDSPSGLTPGYIKILIHQFGKSSETTVTAQTLFSKWSDICLQENLLIRLIALMGATTSVNWVKFVGVCAGFISKTLTQTMILLCELFTEEPEGGMATIPYELFVDLYTFLAQMECGPLTEKELEEQEAIMVEDDICKVANKIKQGLYEDEGEEEALYGEDMVEEGSGPEDSKAEEEKIEEEEEELENEVKGLEEETSEGVEDETKIDEEDEEEGGGLRVEPVKEEEKGEREKEEKNKGEIKEEAEKEGEKDEVSKDEPSKEEVNKEEEAIEEEQKDAEKKEETKDTRKSSRKSYSKVVIESKTEIDAGGEEGEAEGLPVEVEGEGEKPDSKADGSEKSAELTEDKTGKHKSKKKKIKLEDLEESIRARIVEKLEQEEGGVEEETFDEENKEFDNLSSYLLGTAARVQRYTGEAFGFRIFKKFMRQEVPGIGPYIEAEQVEKVIDFMDSWSHKQELMVMPRNIRHWMCPPLDKIPLPEP